MQIIRLWRIAAPLSGKITNETPTFSTVEFRILAPPQAATVTKLGDAGRRVDHDPDAEPCAVLERVAGHFDLARPRRPNSSPAKLGERAGRRRGDASPGASAPVARRVRTPAIFRPPGTASRTDACVRVLPAPAAEGLLAFVRDGGVVEARGAVAPAVPRDEYPARPGGYGRGLVIAAAGGVVTAKTSHHRLCIAGAA